MGGSLSVKERRSILPRLFIAKKCVGRLMGPYHLIAFLVRDAIRIPS